jgi:hypothetical protein
MGFIQKIYGRQIRKGGVQGGEVMIRRQVWTAPATASTTAVHAAITQPTSGTTTVTTAITNPVHVRNLTITGNQATCTGDVVIAGTNIRNESITETIAANGTATVAGNKAFKTVTSIVIPTRGAASDTIAIGTGVKLGLDSKLTEASVLDAFTDGVRETTAATVANSATAIESNTVTTNTAPNATRNFAVLFATRELTTRTQTTV